jgi:glycosyltransferase involved in cell wall biosynthesis
MARKKVALFTTFFDVTSGFSLISVAETQIRMLLNNGYDPIVLVQDRITTDADGKYATEPFEELPPPSIWNNLTIDLRAVVPPLHLTSGVAEDFNQRAEVITDMLYENLKDVDVCITHDIMLMNTYKEHNVAVRRVAEMLPNITWLHWIHSCPDRARNENYPQNVLRMPPPGYIVYPNGFDKSRVASAYGLGGMEWKVKVSRSGHSIDPISLFGTEGLTKDLVEKSGLLHGDVTAIYPARLDAGKQVEKIIYLMAGVKTAGYEPRLLVVDWQSSGGRFQKYIDRLEKLADELGIADCVSFTSRLDDRCSQGVPRNVVMELRDYTNIYVHPSMVETYSLVIHEAMLKGNLCVLNYDFYPMRELFGENAIYMDFGSDRQSRKYDPDVKTFFEDEAVRLIAELHNNRAVMGKTSALRDWTPEALWGDFERLLYLEAVE